MITRRPAIAGSSGRYILTGRLPFFYFFFFSFKFNVLDIIFVQKKKKRFKIFGIIIRSFSNTIICN